MKYFFHFGPPFPLFSGGEWVLHLDHNRPPFLGFRVRGHLCPIFLDVGSVILEIAKQEIVFEEDGVVTNVALRDHAQHFRPHSSMVSLVVLHAPGLETDGGAQSLHSSLLKEMEKCYTLVTRRARHSSA